VIERRSTGAATNLASIFFYLVPESGPDGTCVPQHRLDLIGMGAGNVLLSVDVDLDPSLQQTPKVLRNVDIPGQATTADTFIGLDPIHDDELLQEVIQQQEYAHVIKEEILERIVASLPHVGTEVDGVNVGIRLHAVIPTLPEVMAVVPRPGLSGGLESVSLRIEGTDVSGLDEGSPRATTRRSRRGNRSDVGKNSSGGWHCWLDCWWVKEGGMRGLNSR
jgi:hypothetical protein